MSGDVQPRKRKDKKRKKEDSTEHVPIQPQPSSHSFQSEDINIHVHKDEGTGGGICAKIIFFLLFSVLTVLIGLIITEHRGLTDLDTAEQESRFSHLFEGWIDNSVGHDDHDDEGDHLISSTEDHDEPVSHEELEEHGHDEDDVDEEEPSEEVPQTEEEEEEEEDEEEEVETYEETPQTEEEEDEEQEDTAEDEEPNVSELEENQDEEEVDSEEYGEEAEEEQEEIQSTEAPEDASEEAEDDVKAQSDEVKEEPIIGDEEDPVEEEKEENEQENEDSNSNMVVKIGVGVALLVVAHVVLVRKWKSATPAPPANEEIPDLSRRNTIVAPPPLQEVQRDMQDEEEEYSDEDGEIESEEDRRHGEVTKLRYVELRTTYARSLTPESDGDRPKDVEDDDYEEDEEEEDDDDIEDVEEEYDESDTGEYEKEDEEDDLLDRLEARYGKLPAGSRKSDVEEEFSSWKRINVIGDNEPEESESDKQSDTETYDYGNITNKDDNKIRKQIDEAHTNIQNNTAYALKLFDVLLQNHPSSPRSLYGKAQALDLIADKKRSNDILQKAISTYLQILSVDHVPDALFEMAAERCINRMRFIGSYSKAIEVHQKLIQRFPQVVKYQNELVVSYLTINQVNRARLLLQQILAKHPDDGFALVHYGFILKTADNDLEQSVSYLQRGIATEAPGVIDGRFYFHLGDALSRLGRSEEAMKIYQDGVKHNLFLSKYQRSLYNVARLKGQPWWKRTETPYSDLYTALESNWKKIREEGISVLNKNGQFQSESENLKDTGDWKQFELFARGQKNVNNCKKCPFTCQIIESMPAASGCKRGQTKFSVMHPGTHVWPHCGPTNCRLRVHLGLKVPSNTYIRVADEIRSWKEGKIFIFDDSFEHEVWHNGTSFRLVLIVDVWHPELTSVEKRNLAPI